MINDQGSFFILMEKNISYSPLCSFIEYIKIKIFLLYKLTSTLHFFSHTMCCYTCQYCFGVFVEQRVITNYCKKGHKLVVLSVCHVQMYVLNPANPTCYFSSFPMQGFINCTSNKREKFFKVFSMIKLSICCIRETLKKGFQMSYRCHSLYSPKRLTSFSKPLFNKMNKCPQNQMLSFFLRGSS